ncbi:hypothetical protein DL770_005729 [Monosporascus sp. CRB-9-2]|nr:hypothetical protein DL770_005729 [Monosporascus sp. CRB-9-2]
MPSVPATLTLAGTTPSAPSRGRRLAAARAFAPGALVATFGDDPLVAMPDSAHLSTTCSHCLMSPSGAAVRACTGCRTVHYCSAACQRADWSRAHKEECRAFGRVRAEGHDAAALPTPVRALMRLLLLLAAADKKTGGAAVMVGELEGHVGEFRRAGGKRWRDMELQALAALHYLGREAIPESVTGAVEILCKLQVNSFNRADVDFGESGLLLHPALAMVNHSCMPNAFVQFVGRRAILRAYRAIEEGEEVEISYIECTLHRSHRQEALRSRYHFDCSCVRCTEDLDVYQACQRYPHLELNSFSLTPDLEAFQKPRIKYFLSSNMSLQRNVEEIYSSCSGSLQGMDALGKREELRRRWGKCEQLRKAMLFAIEPLAQFFVESSIYFAEQDDFPAALAVSCFVALQSDPYRSPMPFAAQRVKEMLMIAKLLTNTAPGVASPPANTTTATVRSKLSEILAKMDQITVCQFVLTLVLRWGPAAHSSDWQVCSQAKDLLKDIESLPGREKEYAMVKAFLKNPSGPDEGLFFEVGVLKPIRELSEIAIDVLSAEFES